ncbi:MULTISPECIES: hypothetical protein [Flavobacterium]|uniref:Uncharacterized protein n=1 Tax=Flavobacterium beibuense TaxID=657326 RepID=A0A444WH11_9FLAO|nr:hypothetical protein [Flavobacterium beibuense]RYJ45097.1 hypothetical protein NU09_0731 [Flavobacterium beibuense]
MIKINLVKQKEMKLVKFFLAMLAGFGLIKVYNFVAQMELEEEESDIYDDEHEYPLFV